MGPAWSSCWTPPAPAWSQAGDARLLPKISGLAPGETRVRGNFVAARALVAYPDGSHGTLNQVFDATISTSDADLLRSGLSALAARYGRDSIALGVAISAAVMAVILAIGTVFARRQLGDIQRLTRSAERMAGGTYDEPLRLRRRDEIGELALRFDELRERLRTTTISRDYLDKVLGSMSEALLLVSAQGRITRINPAASQLLECPEAELVGRAVIEVFANSRREEFQLADSAARAQETALLGADGREIPVSYTVSEIHDSDPAFRGFIIAMRNIAERKIAEQRIRYLARIDALTKVPNRMQFQHLLQRTIARAGRQGRQFALLYLDVDRFKEINDIYGHSAGDLCLETLTERVGRLLPENTVVGPLCRG